MFFSSYSRSLTKGQGYKVSRSLNKDQGDIVSSPRSIHQDQG